MKPTISLSCTVCTLEGFLILLSSVLLCLFVFCIKDIDIQKLATNSLKLNNEIQNYMVCALLQKIRKEWALFLPTEKRKAYHRL